MKSKEEEREERNDDELHYTPVLRWYRRETGPCGRPWTAASSHSSTPLRGKRLRDLRPPKLQPAMQRG